MTPASEIVVRWYFDNQGADEYFIEDLVGTLYEGHANNEQDTVEFLANILRFVSEMETEEPWTSLLSVAISLHSELSAVERAIHNLDQISQIASAVENMPESQIGRRISLMKIRECVARLRPYEALPSE